MLENNVFFNTSMGFNLKQNNVFIMRTANGVCEQFNNKTT